MFGRDIKDQLPLPEYKDAVLAKFPYETGLSDIGDVLVTIADGKATLYNGEQVRVTYTGYIRIIENAYYEGKDVDAGVLHLLDHLINLDQQMAQAEEEFGDLKPFRLGYDPVPQWFDLVLVNRSAFIMANAVMFFQPGNWIVPQVGGTVVSIPDSEYTGDRTIIQKIWITGYGDGPDEDGNWEEEEKVILSGPKRSVDSIMSYLREGIE